MNLADLNKDRPFFIGRMILEISKCAMDYFLYIVQCSDKAKSLYTGITTDLEKRINEHNGLSKVPGAKYTRARRPVKLVYSEKLSSRSEALKREIVIKKLSRNNKEILIKNVII